MLRKSLPLIAAGILAASILGAYNIAFAQDVTSDPAKLDQGTNVIWMVGAFLVFFMQAGFAFLGAGLIRSKNTTNYLTKSFMDFAIASLSFWAFGFALMWGTSAMGIIGTTNFFLLDAADGQTYVDWVFQMVFAGTAATIVAGGMAERTKTQTYLAYSFLIGAVIYPLYGHWVWGGGWLGNLEAIGLPAASDYAGSGVVHAVGGFIALAGAAVVGPRIGKFNQDGTANILQGHSIPFVVIGTFILFFGWFGFNINTGDSIGLNAINTLLPIFNDGLLSAIFFNNTSLVVPGYVVLSKMTKVFLVILWDISSVADNTYEISGSLVFLNGVGTQMIIASESGMLS